MSPEQVRGDPDQVGPATDVYGLGVVLYELLTGAPPWEGHPLAVLHQVLNAPPPPPSRHNPAVDPALEAVCRRAMAKEVAGRYASMDELAGDLRAYLRGHARTRGPAQESLPPTTAPAGAGAAHARSPAWGAVGKSRRVWLAVLAAGVLLVAGFVAPGRFVTRGTPDRPDAGRAERPALLVAPFDEATARSAQQQWARHVGRPAPVEENSIGMVLVLIPPGEFLMGSPESPDELVKVFGAPDPAVKGPARGPASPGEQPVHRVRITRPFYLGAHEVTKGQFARFVRATGYKTQPEADGRGSVGYSAEENRFGIIGPQFSWRNTG